MEKQKTEKCSKHDAFNTQLKQSGYNTDSKRIVPALKSKSRGHRLPTDTCYYLLFMSKKLLTLVKKKKKHSAIFGLAYML